MAPPKKTTATNTGTWVYCLVSAARAPAMTRAPEGPPKTGRPRALEVGDGLWLIVSDAPLEIYGEASVNQHLQDLDWVSACALAHERVVEFCRTAKALLPIKLFTMFLSDERALAWAKKEKKQLAKALDRVSGCAEFGVRLTLDERRARQNAEAKLSGAAPAAASGASFLMRKKQVRDVGTDLVKGAKEAADALFAELEALSKAARRRTDVEGLAPGSRLVMDGVFLVPDKAAKKFAAATREATKELSARGYDVTVNGPWPPYHFVADGG